MSKRILIVGFDPHKITFGPERGLTPEGVSATGQATADKLLALGHTVESWLIGPTRTKNLSSTCSLGRNSTSS
ncbi:hypothetical protein SAMN03159463_04209 [Mesorhizobium sp. NFR06]|nr:hypothetical protein SAMN03159463_04209 [Mesorhizobium sp. NFR06]